MAMPGPIQQQAAKLLKAKNLLLLKKQALRLFP
jgi:hypothetical protein